MKIIFAFVLLLNIIEISSSSFLDVCRYSEVSLVLDVSGSITPQQWLQVKEFAQLLVSRITVSQEGNHIGVVTFAETAKKEIHCDEHTSEVSLNSAISSLQQFGQFTNIQDGLEKGKEVLTNRGCGVRTPPPSSRVIILMTDGEANRGDGPQQLINTAQSIRNEGIDIYAVGIRGANIAQLTQITGSADTVIEATNFDGLLSSDLIKKLTAAVCTNPATESTTPYTTSTTAESTTTTTESTKTPLETTTTTESTTTPTYTTPSDSTTTMTDSTTTTDETTTTRKPNSMYLITLY
ncbi:collagen alpha-6(VI) chain-like [Hydractinia symbiolongicarpus]|uniref:collagen alpha-6(VI) chain-like n=1 Tax=Hydractinia symbiolongicarpus TaxID=13093 RepID=UPI0025511CE5|nr:collagen alpha-6(VI) chain-like [Hydractinia symbiolongicarpus]